MNTWKHPGSYGGFSPDGDYVLLTQHRDSELIGRHNWAEACAELKAEAYDGGNDDFGMRPPVYHWRAGHWAVGWVEYLMVRSDALLSRAKAERIAERLENYPILNECAYSEQEYVLTCGYWQQCSVRERASYCKDAGISIFAARRNYLPEDDNGGLFEALREGL